MNLRKVALLSLITAVCGGVVAFGPAWSASASGSAAPAIATSQQPASANVGSSIADQVTVSAPYLCPAEDEYGDPLYNDVTADDGLYCTYPYQDNDPDNYVCEYNASTGELTADHDSGFCPANAVASTGPTPTGTVTFNLPVNYTTSGPCSAIGSRLTFTGVGVCKVTASQAGGSGYASAQSVTRTVLIEYAFKGFADPASKAKLRPGAKIVVQFVLTNAAGKPIPQSVAAALARAHDVNAILSGPRFTARTSVCTEHKSGFECPITAPKRIKSARSRAYWITAEEKVDGEFYTVAPLRSAHNPETVYFK